MKYDDVSKKELKKMSNKALLVDFPDNWPENVHTGLSTNKCKSESSKLKLEIQRLSIELLAARRAILTAGVRKPIYSPGKYTDNG